MLKVSTLIAELKACRSLERGKSLHTVILNSNISDICVHNTLITTYARCGSLTDACKVFQEMVNRTVVSWNALISGHVETGESNVAFDLFSKMEDDGCIPNEATFSVVLKATTELCGDKPKSQQRAQAIPLLASAYGCDSSIYVQSAMVCMFAKCGNMNDAQKVFDRMDSRDVISWTALISGYAENGECEKALDLFSILADESDARTFVAGLKACTNLSGLTRGRALHLLASSRGFHIDTYVQNTLVDMYARCGSMQEAEKVFREIHNPTVVSWNVIILGYAENGDCQLCLKKFITMKGEGYSPNTRTYLAVLMACKDHGTLENGKALHLLASSNGCDSSMFVQSALVELYSNLGSMDDARSVFEKMEVQDVACWTCLILGYAENGEGGIALVMFSRMNLQGCLPDVRMFVAALKAVNSSKLGVRERGQAVHLLASLFGCDSGIFIESTLVDMYAKRGCMEDAWMVFQRMKVRDVVSWTSLILGYAENGEGYIALDLFSEMQREGCASNALTFVAALKACIGLSQDKTQALHLLSSCNGWDSDIYVENCLVDVYAKLGNMEEAAIVFEMMGHRNAVSWNALMLGYADKGDGNMILELFKRMKREGCEPDALTFVAVLKACSMLGALGFGKTIHEEIRSRGFDRGPMLANCLVDFYAKCGSLTEAGQIFDSSPTQDLVTWNALMTGYARQGFSRGVFLVFERMLDMGMRPNGVTFLCVLSACSHSGFVTKGKELFDAMTPKYGIDPSLEHYTTMIDMLGRANKLDAAMVLMKSMPFLPDRVAWTTILEACRKWKNVQLGKLAFEALVSLDATTSRAYVLMASL